MSQALVWSITKNSHSNFLKSRKNGGVQFDKNPANLKNKNTLKFSGYVNQRAGPNNKGVVMPSLITSWKHFTLSPTFFLNFLWNSVVELSTGVPTKVNDKSSSKLATSSAGTTLTSEELLRSVCLLSSEPRSKLDFSKLFSLDFFRL